MGVNNLDARLYEYSGVSRKVARETNVELCDLRKEFVGYLKNNNPWNEERGILTGDRLHLNVVGNRFVAERLLKCLGE